MTTQICRNNHTEEQLRDISGSGPFAYCQGGVDSTAPWSIPLENVLPQAPYLTKSLTYLLFQFTKEHFAIAGGIVSMFYQMTVRKKDYHCLTIIW